MPKLDSNEFDQNMNCPPFSLSSVEGLKYSLKNFDHSQALLVAFICNHCPYVRAIEDRLIELKKSFTPKQFSMLAICSNDAENYPEDSKEELYKRWLKKDYGFPYLIDEDQSVAKAFDAVCTPDLFLFDKNRRLFYHGALDDSWDNPKLVKRQHLKEAIKAIIKDEKPPQNQLHSMGCSIKWKQ